MSANSKFFGNRDAKAVLKHGLLARYAKYFAGRAGLAAHGRVSFIDEYAGTGRYEDGNPGSPLLLATEAESAKSFGRDVKLAFVEQDDKYRARLERTLGDEHVVADQLLGGDFDSALDALLARYDRHAVLLFVDPFGLALSRETLIRVLKRNSARQPIDVLFHFSLLTVARQGALAVTRGPNSIHSAAQLDHALGPDIWRRPFEANQGREGEATEAAIEVARAFAEDLHSITSTRSTSVPVRRRPGMLPTYLLTLLSGDRRAHWDFVDMAGRSYVDWLHHCDQEDFEANLRNDEGQGIQQLFPEPEPDVGTIDRLLAAQAQKHFSETLPRLLKQRGTVRPIDHLEEVYGSMLGQARNRHVQDGFKSLFAAGEIDGECKGRRWMEQPLTWLGGQ